ncbi:MAG: hypothetical protein OEY59_04500 [Deltaproteobacteria bacterium]|nr:hypothetical protein [Deltaproteobacteria bacterium]
MQKIHCPYCLEPLKIKNSLSSVLCPNEACQSMIDREYFEFSPDKITRIGFLGGPGHGKTTFLTSLFLSLNLLNKKLPGFTWRPMDDHSHKQIHYHVPLFEYGILPEATEPDFKKPALITCSRLPYFKDQLFIAYDVAGENWEDLNNINEITKLVSSCNVIWLKISIIDSIPNLENQINSMLHGYIQKINALGGIDLKRQHLIVILTKSELMSKNHLKDIQPFPQVLSDWLRDGSYQSYLDFKEGGISKLKSISQEIEKWLIENHCAGFVNLAKDEFSSVEYTIVSATGSEPVHIYKDISSLIHKLGLTFKITGDSLESLPENLPGIIIDQLKDLIGQNLSVLSLEKKVLKILKDREIRKVTGARIDEYLKIIIEGICLGEADQIAMSKIHPNDPKRVLDPLFLTLDKQKIRMPEKISLPEESATSTGKGFFGLFGKKN